MSIRNDLRPHNRYNKVQHAIEQLPPDEQAEVREVILDPNYSHSDIAAWLTKKTVDHTGNVLDRKQVNSYADKLKKGTA